MKRICCIFMFIILISLLTGCGHKDKETTAGWKEQGFQLSDRIDKNNEYWIESFAQMDADGKSYNGGEEFKYAIISPKTYKDKVYCLYALIKPPVLKASKWIMEIYDSSTGQIQEKEISYELMGLSDEIVDGEISYLVDVDWIDESHYVFQWVSILHEGDTYQQFSDKRIITDLTGETNQVELWNEYVKYGMQENVYNYSFIPQASCLCDGKRNIYQIINQIEGMSLLVFNGQGSLNLAYQVPENCEISDYLRTPGDEILFLLNDEKASTQRFLWIESTGDKPKIKEVASIHLDDRIVKLCGMTESEIYYETAQGMVYSWNIEDGNRVLFLNYPENNLPQYYERIFILGSESIPEIVLFRNRNADFEKSEEWLVHLSKENGNKEVQISILATEGAGEKIIREATSLTSKTNPNYLFDIEKIDTGEKKELLISELIAGTGPDVIYLSRDDFCMLAERGLLMDFSSMIGQEVLDNILPAARELGTFDDKLLGIPVCVTAASILISNEVWDQDKWTIDDMLKLIRENKINGLVYYVNAEKNFTPLAASNIIIRNSLHESWLIDWERGLCHFDDSSFIDLLKALKEADQTYADTGWLSGGKRIAYYDMSSPDFSYVFGIREESENARWVGFPTERESGSYLDTEGILAIRAATDKTETIRNLLACIFEDSIQKYVDTSVKTALSIKKKAIENTLSAEGAGDREVYILKNGISTECMAELFLEQCTAAPLHEIEIENIIIEELPPFFLGEKSAEEVAGTIQNRVQLYLDERK